MGSIFGINFSTASGEQILDKIARDLVPTGAGVRSILTANLDHIVNLQKSSEFRRAYASAWTVTIDGAPVFLYAKLRKVAPPARVTGADLFAQLMPRLPAEAKCFFVASAPETGEKLKAYLVSRGFASDAVAFVVPPYGFENDQAYSAQLAEQIKAHGTTHLFMGVGAPKSEVWVHSYRDKIGDCYALCIGAALEFFVGDKKRAPVWMQHVGLEWSWRLCQEPRRLFRRYGINSWYFLVAAKRDLMSPAPELGMLADVR